MTGATELAEADEGGVGYLTWPQFNTFRWARSHERALVTWLRVAGYIRSGDADVRVASSSQGHIGLPPTWLAADAIVRLGAELDSWGTDEAAANDSWGAKLALIFSREVETADARWPAEDTAHNVRHMRCPACSHLALRYEPPKVSGERVVVRCMLCAKAMDEDGFSVAALLMEVEENATRGLGDDEGSDREGEKVA